MVLMVVITGLMSKCGIDVSHYWAYEEVWY